ncbi:ABC transporter substrate-binding protein [Jiangella asiatica]|uniref:ABC transporter substrate-binding protein n=1 Tax=Jiangella asiatica TaxID=2530372 RepID=UPI0013A5D82B
MKWGVAAGAALGLVGCGSDETGSQGQGGSATPRRGGTLTIAQPTEANPAQALNQNIANQSWRRAVYDCLVDFDPERREVVEGLATAWETSADGKQVVLTLRDGVTWHSGRPFGADDVEFAIDNAINSTPSFQLAWAFQNLQGIDKAGNTVTLAFSEPATSIYDALSLLTIIDRESHDAFVDGTAHVGTGPFVWGDFAPGTNITLRRNENYWLPDRPYLDGMEVRFITRSEALVSAVRSEQVDMGLNLLPLDRGTVEQDGRFDVVAYNTYGAALYVGANVEVEPLNRKEVRQAINYAIDRQRINDELYQGQGKVSAAPWSPTSPAYDEGWAEAYSRDLDRARSLLASAGAIDQVIAVEANAAQSRAAEIVAFNLSEIGLETDIQILEPAVITERFQNRSFAGLYLAFHGWNTLSPVNVVYSAAPLRVDNNLFRFASDEYARLAGELATAVEDDQHAAIEALTEFILDEAFCLDAVHTSNNVVTQQDVHGWAYNVWDEMLFADAWKS